MRQWQYFVCGGFGLPAFLFRVFLSSIAIVAGPLVAATLAAVVDFVELSLLVGVVCICTEVKRGQEGVVGRLFWLGIYGFRFRSHFRFILFILIIFGVRGGGMRWHAVKCSWYVYLFFHGRGVPV